MKQTAESQLLALARDGNRGAYSELVRRTLPRLRSVVKRLVGHPEDTDELVQDTLLRAWEKLDSFEGTSSFLTWVCAIGARLAIDHLRAETPWRHRAQIAYANQCASDPEWGAEVGAVMMDPEYVFDAREHIAYCFACVGRSLPPQLHASLVLREVLQLSTQEASDILGVTESVLKHQLSQARTEMSQRFDDLCSLVNKNGVCYQCKGLREGSHRKTTEQIDVIDMLETRIQLVKSVDPATGVASMLHDLFWRRTAQQERACVGSTDAETDCGQ